MRVRPECTGLCDCCKPVACDSSQQVCSCTHHRGMVAVNAPLLPPQPTHAVALTQAVAVPAASVQRSAPPRPSPGAHSSTPPTAATSPHGPWPRPASTASSAASLPRVRAMLDALLVLSSLVHAARSWHGLAGTSACGVPLCVALLLARRLGRGGALLTLSHTPVRPAGGKMDDCTCVVALVQDAGSA